MKNVKELDNIIEQIVTDKLKVNKGEDVVVRSYYHTMKYLESEHIVINNIVWENDYQEFIEMLRKLNIEKIIIANKSTALMGLLHFLISEGCMLEEAVTITENKEFGGSVKGLLIKIN